MLTSKNWRARNHAISLGRLYWLLANRMDNLPRLKIGILEPYYVKPFSGGKNSVVCYTINNVLYVVSTHLWMRITMVDRAIIIIWYSPHNRSIKGALCSYIIL